MSALSQDACLGAVIIYPAPYLGKAAANPREPVCLSSGQVWCPTFDWVRIVWQRGWENLPLSNELADVSSVSSSARLSLAQKWRRHIAQADLGEPDFVFWLRSPRFRFVPNLPFSIRRGVDRGGYEIGSFVMQYPHAKYAECCWGELSAPFGSGSLGERVSLIGSFGGFAPVAEDERGGEICESLLMSNFRDGKFQTSMRWSVAKSLGIDADMPSGYDPACSHCEVDGRGEVWV